MQKSGVNRNPSLRVAIPQAQQSLRRLGFCSQIATGGSQQSSPVVFPEKRSRKVKASSRRGEISNDPQVKPKADEHRIDIGGGDEKSDLLGSLVYSGKLLLDKRKSASGKDATETQQPSATDIFNKKAVDAKLTSRALVWGSDMLQHDDVVSLTYNVGLRHFTVHAYPVGKGSCALSCFTKPKRSRKDFRFIAPTVEEAVQWVASFADQQCFINCLPHPLVSKKQASSELFSVPIDTPPELVFRCKSAPKMLVILNPRSGHGRSTKVFHDVVEPIFKLAGIKMEVVKTNKAGHARELASTVDISLCSDGIICVGGDGIINEVLNGLLSRSNQKEGVSIPIGIVPAGSDNSLVWTVLGVRDPISAALSIVKGGLTATDVFAVEWIHTGVIHFGMTVSYYGFVSDVLELSEKYQKRFGPMRYLVAGFLKFMCLPKYSYEVEYLPAQKEDAEGKTRLEKEVVDVQDLYTDVMRRSSKEGMPRASSLSSIDSIMTPSVGELDTCSSTHASAEPSEYVRGIDAKMKRMSSGRRDVAAEPEIIHPQGQSTTPNWPRTRSKSRTDKGWMGLTSVQDPPPTRCSWGNTGAHDREDISSTVSDPGPIWDAGPKWDTEPSAWDVENSIELPGPPEDIETGLRKQTMTPRFENKWVARKGHFLGIMVCNHACRTVQSSQVVAPNSEHDDGTMDMLLVHGCGRLRLMRFFILLQTGRHLSLPYVECVKVKSVKIKAGKQTHDSCGIDGELFALNGEVISTMLPEQCRLIEEFVAHSAAVNCLKIGRKSSRVLVTGGEDHKVNLWALGKPNAILSLYGHSSGIDSVTFDASEVLVAAGAASGTIKLWDLEEAKIVRTLTGHRSNCISVDFHPFGEFFASGSLDTNLKIWDLRKKDPIHTYKGHTRGVNVLRFTPDGRWVVSGGEDNIVKVWDLTAGKLLTEFKCHEGQIQSLDFHPHEFLLATGSADRTVKFWDLETFELIGSGGPETSGVRCLSFNPDGKTVLCGLQESLKIFSWEPIRCHDGVDVGWSRLSDMNVHEGKLLGCSYNQSCVGVWVVDLSRTEPCMAGDAAQSNGHPEKKSGSGRDPVVLNDNNSKTILGKLSISQNIDPLLKETKSLGRLSVSQNSDFSIKETKAIGRSSTSQNSESLMKESKPLGRLSVSQNSDVAKESRTLSTTGSVPGTPHRVSLTSVSKAASGVSNAVSNAATSRRNFTKANPKANPVSKAADFVPVIVPREDPRIEQATDSRAELDIIARTMPYSLQAADSRRSPSSRNNPELPNASVLEMSESQPVEPSNIPDGNTFPGGKGGMKGAADRSINDFRYKRYGRSNSRSRMGSPPRNHDENYDLVSHKSNRDPSPTESRKGGRFQSLVINRERRGRFSNFEGPAPNFSAGNVPAPNIRPSNMFKQRGNHMPVEQGIDSPSEDNIVEDIMGKHDQFVSSMQSRLAKLQVVRRYWERNDVKNSIGSMEKMADNAVIADVLGIITERNEILTLDTCTSLLPILTALLGSDMDQHLSVSLDLLLKLVRMYGSPIYSSLSAPASVGVDIEAEQRIERYSRCFVELEKVKACLPSLSRRGGLVAKSVLELNLAFQEVSS